MNDIRAGKSTQSLLRRAQLLPGESLPSLLERLVQLNYYPSLQTLIQIRCGPLTAGSLACPQSVDTFLWLSDLTSIPPKDLYAASNHYLGSFLKSPQPLPANFSWVQENSKIRLPKNQAYDTFRFVTSAQYCPECLRSTGYHRLIWFLIPATICLEHQCLLVNQCPKCHKQISIQEIVKKHCKVCRNDLSTVKSLSVAGDQWGLRSQQAIQSWFAAAGLVESPSKSNLPPVHPGELYRFLQILSGCLLMRQKDWGILPNPLHQLPRQINLPMHKWLRPRQQLLSLNSEEIFRLYRAAFSGIMDWPKGMFRFLDAYSGYSTPPQNLACQEQSLRSLRSSWGWAFWRNPDFEFAQCSFVDYLMIRKIPFPVALVERFRNEKWFVEKTGLCSIEYAASAADITIQDLNQLLQHGMLRPCTWEYARRNIPILETKKLLKLKQKWKAGWSVEEASSWLGISKQNVIQLIRLGLLVIAQKTKSGKSKRLLSCQSVKEFFEKVTAQLKLFGDDPREIISLRRADGYFNYLGVDGSVLLQFVVNGVLPAFQWRDEIQRLNQICFSLVSIHEIPDLVLGRRGCITADAFAIETGIPKSLVRKWVKTGLIRAEMKIGLDDYFKRLDLEKLAGEYFSD